MRTIDFLSQPSHERLRKEIQNICDSYNHPWDIISELCQNSIDAIILYNKKYGKDAKKDHKIEITLNAQKRSIKIYDTGVGFSAKKFTELLAPHGTDKVGLYIIGEKGVGLTYTIFTSNYYKIKTKSIQAYIEGYIENAALWKNGKLNEIPMFNIVTWDEIEFPPQETFTEIYLEDAERVYSENEDIFYQNINVLEYILRTKTAIGYLKDIFGERKLDISAKLTLVDLNGYKNVIDLKPRYMLPEESINPSNVVDLEKFKKIAASLDDRQKARQLQGKSIIKKGHEIRASRKINYYVFFASRRFFSEFSEKNGLFTINESGDKNYLYKGGIYIGSRGMPTGIRLEPPISGSAGYWPNFYIILEDDSITFDLGRKSIPNRTKGLLRDITKKLFQEFMPYIKYVSSDPAIISSIQQYEKNKMFEELNKLPDLGINRIGYQKHPDGQEAAVVALFHELVGAGILQGYYTFKTGYKQTYDLWGVYRIKKDLIGDKYKHLADESGYIKTPIILEFKFKAEDILKEFENNLKYFIDIDLIVCWDLDETKFARQNVKVELLEKDDIFFFGSNYKLIWPGAYNLGTAGEKPVLALRKFIQDYQTSI